MARYIISGADVAGRLTEIFVRNGYMTTVEKAKDSCTKYIVHTTDQDNLDDIETAERLNEDKKIHWGEEQ